MGGAGLECTNSFLTCHSLQNNIITLSRFVSSSSEISWPNQSAPVERIVLMSGRSHTAVLLQQISQQQCIHLYEKENFDYKKTGPYGLASKAHNISPSQLKWIIFHDYYNIRAL